MTEPGSAVHQPRTTSLRCFEPDERCRFRPITEGVRVVIRLTLRCDMACGYCLAGPRAVGAELERRRWARVLADLPRIGARKVLLTGGEPLLHEDLEALVRLISGLGIPVDLNTNLFRMSRARLRALRAAGLTEISTAIQGPASVHDEDHGRPGAHAHALRAVRWASDEGIRVDASLCLRRSNVHYLDRTLDELQGLPLASVTVSRCFPVGHGSALASGALPPEELTAAYAHLCREWVPRSRFPIRLVGLLGLPRPIDCRRGETLVGLSPDGRLLACVLMPKHPRSLPQPLEVGLPAAVEALRSHLARTAYALCCPEAS